DVKYGPRRVAVLWAERGRIELEVLDDVFAEHRAEEGVEHIAGGQEVHHVQVVVGRGAPDGRLSELAVCIDDARQTECRGDRVAQRPRYVDEFLGSRGDASGIFAALITDYDFRDVRFGVRGARA